MAAVSPQLAAKLLEITRMKYADQAKWYLNGFWKEGAEAETENVWKYTHKFAELDEKKKKEGNELDEFQAHKFLEFLGETLTVIQLREKLRKIDVDNNGKMALLEYLAFKYGKTVQAVIDAPQGDNTEEVNAAAEKLQAVQDALTELVQELEQQQQALSDQKRAVKEQEAAIQAQKQAVEEMDRALGEQRRAEDEVRQALEKQKAAEETVRRAEADLRAAIDDLKGQEEAYHKQIQSLESKSTDPSLGTVAKSKAANELAQLKQTDPLPLRKAKVTQEAALKKVEKERKAQEEATAACEARSRDAEAKTRELEVKKQDLEEKTRQLEEKKRQLDKRLSFWRKKQEMWSRQFETPRLACKKRETFSRR